MSTLSLPAPSDDRPHESRGSTDGPSRDAPRGQRRHAEGRQHIPSADDCLELLHRLGGLVAMGVLATKQATVLRGIYQTILQHHQRQRVAPTQQVLEGAEMLEKLRGDPDLVNMLAPFLTEAQLAELLADHPEASDGSV